MKAYLWDEISRSLSTSCCVLGNFPVRVHFPYWTCTHLVLVCARLLVTFWSWALGQSSSHPLTLAEFGEPQSPGYRPVVCREAAVVAVAGLYHWSKWLFCPQSKYECRDVTKHWAESHHTTGLWKRSESIWLKANSTLKTAGKVTLVCCYRLPNVLYFNSHYQEICFVKNVVLQCHWQPIIYHLLIVGTMCECSMNVSEDRCMLCVFYNSLFCCKAGRQQIFNFLISIREAEVCRRERVCPQAWEHLKFKGSMTTWTQDSLCMKMCCI